MLIKGIVIQGKQRGHGLGFPTANIKFEGDLASGVYAGIVNFQGKEYRAAIFYGNDKKIMEAHILGISGDLYGKLIEIKPLKKIREVMKFESDEEMKQQIVADIKKIRNMFL